MTSSFTDRSFLTRFAWLSIAAAIVTIALKSAAYLLTGSVGLLSDALESLVNLVGALMALAMLTIAARPADEDHAYGHSKAEYFSSGVEGTLILLAAISIGYVAVLRIITPQPIEKIGLGLIVSVGASVVNLIVAIILLKAGKQYNSITLEASSKHLMTDVWTSAGVVIGVGAVALTNWVILDPIVAIIIALNIIRTAYQIMRKSVLGLLDRAIPVNDMNSLKNILDTYSSGGIEFHALRTRQAGSRQFISFHVLVPGEWSVDKGHHFLEQLEHDIRKSLVNATIFTHLESLNDPASWEDVNLDRALED